MGPTASDREAFNALHRATLPAVRRWLLKLGVAPSDCDDVSQEVYLAAYRSWLVYDPRRGSVEVWLHGIAFNLASHYRERAHRRREELRADPGADAVDESMSPEERATIEDERRYVNELLRFIPPDERLVLIAHDLDGVAMTDIAFAVHLPLSSTYKRLHRARALFRAAYERKLHEPRTYGRKGTPFDPEAWVDDYLDIKHAKEILLHVLRQLAQRQTRDDPILDEACATDAVTPGATPVPYVPPPPRARPRCRLPAGMPRSGIAHVVRYNRQPPAPGTRRLRPLKPMKIGKQNPERIRAILGEGLPRPVLAPLPEPSRMVGLTIAELSMPVHLM